LGRNSSSRSERIVCTPWLLGGLTIIRTKNARQVSDRPNLSPLPAPKSLSRQAYARVCWQFFDWCTRAADGEGAFEISTNCPILSIVLREKRHFWRGALRARGPAVEFEPQRRRDWQVEF